MLTFTLKFEILFNQAFLPDLLIFMKFYNGQFFMNY